jgi:hypothetical protein
MVDSDDFAKLKVPEMKTILKGLHNSKRHGKVKYSGKKEELIEEFRRVYGQAASPTTSDAEGTDAEDTEPSAEKIEQLAQAHAVMDSLIIPSARTVSKSTKRVMKDLGYATRYELRKEDLSDSLDVSQMYEPLRHC